MRLASVALRLRGVAEVVEHVVAPDAEVLELDPLAAVRVLHAHVAAGPADAVAGAPVVVAGAEVRRGRELEALAVGLDPALLAAEAVVAGDRAHGAAAHDDAGAELAEDGPLRIEPGDVEGRRPCSLGSRTRRHWRKGSTTSKLKGPSVMSMRSLRALLVGPHGGVLAADVDDGEGLGRAEVRVEGEADHDEQLAHLVLAGEPHALVGLRVGRPHDAHGVGRVVDEELVEAGEGGVLCRGRVGRGTRGVRRRGHVPSIDLCSRSPSRPTGPCWRPMPLWLYPPKGDRRMGSAERGETTAIRSSAAAGRHWPPMERVSYSVRTR